MTTVELKEYDYDEKVTVIVAEARMKAIANAVRPPELFAELLEDVVNSYDVTTSLYGAAVGKYLCKCHPTLQRSLVVTLLGIIEALAEVDYTDRRNAKAIAACKGIVAMHLVVGSFV